LLCCIAFGAWLSSCKKQFAAWLHGYEKNLCFWRARLAWCKKVHCTPFGFRKYQAHLLVQVTAQVTKQQLNATRLDKCRYPIIAILHVPSLSHGSLALGYEPGWVDAETNHAPRCYSSDVSAGRGIDQANSDKHSINLGLLKFGGAPFLGVQSSHPPRSWRPDDTAARNFLAVYDKFNHTMQN